MAGNDRWWRRHGQRAALALGVVAAAAAVVALAARAGQQAQSEADARELQTYRLTMPKVRQMNEAYLAYFKALQSDPQFLALQKAREELRSLEHKETLTAADERRIEQLESQIERAEDVAAIDAGESQSLEEVVRAIEAQPGFAKAIRSAGLDAREFAKIQLSLFQAMFAHGFMKSGSVKELPKEVPAENVAFVREHEGELTAMAKQWQGLAGPGEQDEGDADLPDEEDLASEDEEPVHDER